ncbi:hypothetical protein NL676_020617 [Syzygium grande]|nr:hypothetical protein NL676_020617 [Syzygium grande]
MTPGLVTSRRFGPKWARFLDRLAPVRKARPDPEEILQNDVVTREQQWRRRRRVPARSQRREEETRLLGSRKMFGLSLAPSRLDVDPAPAYLQQRRKVRLGSAYKPLFHFGYCHQYQLLEMLQHMRKEIGSTDGTDNWDEP